jgi:hypothetical protein
MADKNIQMTQRNTDNTGWDNLFPKTKAGNVAVLDSENYFTGNDLETVLNELFTNANNGKINIAGVIGSPAQSSDTFDTLKNYIQTDKNTLATNLSNKGQLAANTETLEALVAKVANIVPGKQYASGSIFSSASPYKIIVTGLTFTPTKVVYWEFDTAADMACEYGILTSLSNEMKDNLGNSVKGYYGGSRPYWYWIDSANANYGIVAGGFKANVWADRMLYKWFAIKE